MIGKARYGIIFLPSSSKDYTLIRYDARGNGLSDWDVPNLSFETWIGDLGTVIDAAGLKRFPIFALSQGCAISIAYAGAPSRASIAFDPARRLRARRQQAIASAKRQSATR